MELMTLRTMCERLNVSRRSIQCYEQAGLLKPSAKINMVICYMMSRRFREHK